MILQDSLFVWLNSSYYFFYKNKLYKAVYAANPGIMKTLGDPFAYNMNINPSLLSDKLEK